MEKLYEGEHEVEVVVENGAGRANLSLLVTAEEPIRGLRATPSPEALPGCSASPHSPWCQYYSQIHT